MGGVLKANNSVNVGCYFLVFVQVLCLALQNRLHIIIFAPHQDLEIRLHMAMKVVVFFFFVLV